MLVLQPSREMQHEVGSWLLPEPAGPPGTPSGMRHGGAVPLSPHSSHLCQRGADDADGGGTRRGQPEPPHAGSARSFAGNSCGNGVWGYLWNHGSPSWVHMGWQIKLLSTCASPGHLHPAGSWPGGSLELPRVQGELPMLGALGGCPGQAAGCECSGIVPCVPGCRGATCGNHPGRNAGLAVPVARSVSCFCLWYWKSRALRCKQC